MMRDDTEIWDVVKQTVKPLKGKAKAKATAILPKKKKVLPSSVPKVTEVPVVKQVKNHLPAKQVRKLRRQEIPVEAALDLHGMTAERAHAALRRFLGRARQKGWRCIEVITGRGDPERGTGKLRRELPLWLEEETGILHVTENPRTRGGSFLIMLRRAGK